MSKGKLLRLVAGGALALGAVWYLFFASAARQGKAVSVDLVRVIDGDSIVVRRGASQIELRLSGIDAPELGQPDGPMVKSQLVKMLGQGWLEAVFLTAEPDAQGRRDAQVFVVSDDGASIWVQGTMVRSGWAWVVPNTTKDHELWGIESMARAEKRGVWERQSEPPWQWRSRILASQ